MKHVRDLVGIEHVALGSDFDGAVETLFDVSELAALTQALLDTGFSKGEIGVILFKPGFGFATVSHKCAYDEDRRWGAAVQRIRIRGGFHGISRSRDGSMIRSARRATRMLKAKKMPK